MFQKLNDKHLVVRAIALSLLVAYPLLGSGAARANEVEVVHQWTSSGEAFALQAIKDALAKQQIGWKDSAVAGNGGANQRQVMQARLAAGNAPVASQAMAQLVITYQKQHWLENMDSYAKAGNWDTAISPELRPYAKVNGSYFAVPINEHRENMLWINKSLLNKYGGKVPTTWDEFFELAEKMKKDGIIPLALGGEDWQEAEIFSDLLLSTGGTDLYKKVILQRDLPTIQGPAMKKVFETFRKILSYTDKNRAGRDWNVATQMVINGKAGMQIHADWAKGEFLRQNKKPDVDFVCTAAPGTKNNFVFVTDFFVFFKQKKVESITNQQAFANTVMNPAVQEEFNLRKGSIPARIDVPADRFDSCAKMNIADRAEIQKSGGMLPSFIENTGQPLPARAVFLDVITNFATTPSQTPDDAVRKLVSGLKAL